MSDQDNQSGSTTGIEMLPSNLSWEHIIGMEVPDLETLSPRERLVLDFTTWVTLQLEVDGSEVIDEEDSATAFYERKTDRPNLLLPKEIRLSSDTGKNRGDKNKGTAFFDVDLDFADQITAWVVVDILPSLSENPDDESYIVDSIGFRYEPANGDGIELGLEDGFDSEKYQLLSCTVGYLKFALSIDYEPIQR